ncbi:MAG: 2,3,4,5-tetrahydropyridine-2-carboxylate N-succinyltransferase, partial [Psychroserpens sp.]
MTELRQIIEKAWDDRELLKDDKTQAAIRKIIDLLDIGQLRCAEPTADGWQINEWVKKAVVLYFPIQKMQTLEVGIFEYHDKMPLKRGYAEKGIRVVPNAVARHGAYISAGT